MPRTHPPGRFPETPISDELRDRILQYLRSILSPKEDKILSIEADEKPGQIVYETEGGKVYRRISEDGLYIYFNWIPRRRGESSAMPKNAFLDELSEKQLI